MLSTCYQSGGQGTKVRRGEGVGAVGGGGSGGGEVWRLSSKRAGVPGEAFSVTVANYG